MALPATAASVRSAIAEAAAMHIAHTRLPSVPAHDAGLFPRTGVGQSFDVGECPSTSGPGRFCVIVATLEAAHAHDNLRPSNVELEDVTISYLHRVRLATALEIYAEFLTAMTDFKTGLADTVAIISRVRQQFSGHPHLVTGFHVFLPAGHKITQEMGR